MSKNWIFSGIRQKSGRESWTWRQEKIPQSHPAFVLGYSNYSALFQLTWLLISSRTSVGWKCLRLTLLAVCPTDSTLKLGGEAEFQNRLNFKVPTKSSWQQINCNGRCIFPFLHAEYKWKKCLQSLIYLVLLSQPKSFISIVLKTQKTIWRKALFWRTALEHWFLNKNIAWKDSIPRHHLWQYVYFLIHAKTFLLKLEQLTARDLN